jgi:hypothetical protein
MSSGADWRSCPNSVQPAHAVPTSATLWAAVVSASNGVSARAAAAAVVRGDAEPRALAVTAGSHSMLGMEFQFQFVP